MNIISVPVVIAKQDSNELICFSMKAKELWKIVDINKRDPDKDKGYQRVLSASRVQAISKFIDSGKIIPTCILVSLAKPVKFSPNKTHLLIPKNKKAGWVIDGQHRLAGANEATKEIEFVVVAFLDLPLDEQIRQFMTINNESKGVPTSLIYDLLSYMPPNKTTADIAKEQAAEIAKMLAKDESSPFYGSISIISSPKKGELSLTNFVRKIAPLIVKDKGKFNKYSLEEQKKIVENYYKALIHVYPEQSDPSTSVLFLTIGFGAAFNAIDTVFDYSLKLTQGFTVPDIIRILKNVEDFNLNDWKNYGTGNAAEMQAGNDYRIALELRMADNNNGKDKIRL